jgi:thiol:disulfide interchange protein DsbC
MRKIFVLTAVVISLCTAVSFAASRSGVQKDTQQKITKESNQKAIHSCASCHSLSKEEAGTIFKGLGEVTDVKTSPLKGLYEITVQQKNRRAVAYLDFGKKLLVPGPIFNIATKRPITPPPVELPKVISKVELDKIPLANSIVMGNPDGKKRLFVFTDPDCPFCGRLHGELKKLVAMEPDLAVYIKMYPLKSHPAAYDKARVILGSKSLELLEKAFSGEKLPAPGDRDPGLPVDESLSLGDSLGVEGTPAMIFPDGTLVSGFRDAKTLRALLTEEITGK